MARYPLHPIHHSVSRKIYCTCDRKMLQVRSTLILTGNVCQCVNAHI